MRVSSMLSDCQGSPLRLALFLASKRLLRDEHSRRGAVFRTPR
jgi:hypothetical protein